MERQTYHICQDNVGMALSGAILSHTNYPGNDYPADVTCDLAIDPGGRFVGVYITFFDVSLKVFQVDTLQRKCSPPSESVVVSSLYPDVPTNLTVCQNDGNRSSTAIGSTVLVSLNTASHNGIHYRGFKAVFTQYYPPNVSYEATSPCHKDDFYCVGVFRCIPGFLRCDGVNHCGNYVDETNCPDEFKVPSKNDICNPDEFYCGSYAGPGRTCISKQFVCDGKKLCSNGADEKSCKIAVESGLSAKAMVGVVLGLLQVVVLAAFITRYMHGRRRKKKRNRVLTNTGYDAIALEPR
ncbi:low-density lipoprotein receptor-related protein 12-like [Glandiceps talaboti]